MSSDGSVAIVTGGTSGIGKALTQGIAAHVSHVVVLGRDTAKGAAAVRELRLETGHENVEFYRVDLAVQTEIRQFVRAFAARFDRLDLLVNNAGVTLPTRVDTVDGIETTFAVNVVAPFVLTTLLRPQLRAVSGRVVNVSSGLHEGSSLDFASIANPPSYDGLRAYRQSKFALVALTYAFASRLADDGITVNCYDPGFIPGTSLNRYDSGVLGRVFRVFARLPFLPTAEDGARTGVYLATSPAVASTTGEYFVDEQVSRSAFETYDPALQDRLWSICRDLSGSTANPER